MHNDLGTCRKLSLSALLTSLTISLTLFVFYDHSFATVVTYFVVMYCLNMCFHYFIVFDSKNKNGSKKRE